MERNLRIFWTQEIFSNLSLEIYRIVMCYAVYSDNFENRLINFYHNRVREQNPKCVCFNIRRLNQSSSVQLMMIKIFSALSPRETSNSFLEHHTFLKPSPTEFQQRL